MSRPSSRQKDRPSSRSKTVGKEFISDDNNSEGDIDESIVEGKYKYNSIYYQY